MVHGAQDNYQVKPKSTIYQFSDDAELAVRLGCPSVFERAGNILFMDSFNNDLGACHAGFSGAGGSTAIDTTKFRSDGFSLKLTAGSNLFKYANVRTYLPYPVLSIFGFEVSIALKEHIDYIYFYIELYNGTHRVRARIKYDHTNENLQYMDSDGLNQNIDSSFSLYQYDRIFYTFKVVANFVTNKYLRIIANTKSYDISTILMQSLVSGEDPYLTVSVEVFSEGANNAVLYVDNIIVTQNEE